MKYVSMKVLRGIGKNEKQCKLVEKRKIIKMSIFIAVI